MKPLLERLKEEVLVCDGATGTELIANGMPQSACPDLWGVKNHRILSSIHKAYVEAGADMITTNTFGANSIKLKVFNLERKIADINKRAVEIAKKAAKDRAYVLGDIGPCGKYLKPAGEIEPEDMRDNFREQVKLLYGAGVDGIILETMSDMEELKAAIMAVKESVKLPLIASMTFQKTQARGYRTTSGISIPQFVDESLLAGCDVIGTNCTLTADDMVGLIAEIRKLGTAFLIAQPNAGMPKIVEEKPVYEESPDKFAEYIPELIGAGANIIGGCCGTTPEHIRKVRQRIST
ncbi:MAG: homocysteine S-methyltransferase family protein [Candidatus Omnitrophica bacterium]|nr:homocysteine S-methyltransferase family protein [Candidatus Omnitrophota bacterium]